MKHKLSIKCENLSYIGTYLKIINTIKRNKTQTSVIWMHKNILTLKIKSAKICSFIQPTFKICTINK